MQRDSDKTHIETHIDRYRETRVYRHTHAGTGMRRRTHAYTCIPDAHTHTRAHTYIHTLAHTKPGRRIQIHTDTVIHHRQTQADTR